MRIYDISLTLSNKLPVWPGDPAIEIKRTSKMEEGADANVTHLRIGAHVGTHVDAPYHFLGAGHSTVDSLDLKVLTGRVYVLQIEDHVDEITSQQLSSASIPPRTRRLIFKTRNSRIWSQGSTEFEEDFVALSPDGAKFLVDKGIKLVGIDYLSIAPFKAGGPTHKILLEAGVVVLEGLYLNDVSPGRYTLYCLPLKIEGADGAPARAILVGV